MSEGGRGKAEAWGGLSGISAGCPYERLSQDAEPRRGGGSWMHQDEGHLKPAFSGLNPALPNLFLYALDQLGLLPGFYSNWPAWVIGLGGRGDDKSWAGCVLLSSKGSIFVVSSPLICCCPKPMGVCGQPLGSASEGWGAGEPQDAM